MPISTHCLEAYVNNCAAASPDCLEVQQLVGVASAIESAAVGYSVANIASLPAAENNEGRMIFVEDIGAYRYSNGLFWTNSYDSTVSTIYKELFLSGCGVQGQLGNNSIACLSSPVKEITSSSWCFVTTEPVGTGGIKVDGTIWSWGCNDFGKLGNGSVAIPPSCSPIQEISSSTNWCFFNKGCKSSHAIKNDNTLWSWGCNGCGNAAINGGIASISSPIREYTSSLWTSVSGGGYSVSGLKTEGTLWGWGHNYRGQVGNNTVGVRYSSPVQEITSSTNWCNLAIADGRNQNFIAIKTDGTLWGSGRNGYGELADGTSVSKSSPVQETSSSSNWCLASGGARNTFAIKTDGTIWGWGIVLCVGNRSSPVQEFTSSTNWCFISASSGLSISAIKTDGTLWVWGCNTLGQLGINDAISRSAPVQEITSSSDWSYVSSGYRHIARIRNRVKGFNEP